MPAHLIQPDPNRCAIVATPRVGGGWTLQAGRTRLHLTTHEINEFINIINEETK